MQSYCVTSLRARGLVIVSGEVSQVYLRTWHPDLVYFQYISSRPQESYKVVSLPSIQLTPKNQSPTGGRCSLDLLLCVREWGLDFDGFCCIFCDSWCEHRMFWARWEGTHSLIIDLAILSARMMLSYFVFILGSMGVNCCHERSVATIFAHITLNPEYFQYTRSRP